MMDKVKLLELAKIFYVVLHEYNQGDEDFDQTLEHLYPSQRLNRAAVKCFKLKKLILNQASLFLNRNHILTPDLPVGTLSDVMIDHFDELGI